MADDIARPSERKIDIIETDRGYDLWAAIYDAEDNALIALEEKHFPPLVGAVRGLDVVDVGCGTGRHALALAAAGARVTAIDFSRGMLAKASEKPNADRVRFVEHDLSKTPYPLESRSFDRVISALVLEHIEDHAAFFAELARICRPGGFVLISAMHPAMMLRGVEAHFTDPATGREIRPRGYQGQLSDFVMGAVRAGLGIEHMSEHAIGPDLAARSRRIGKHQGWPLLVLMKLSAPR